MSVLASELALLAPLEWVGVAWVACFGTALLVCFYLFGYGWHCGENKYKGNLMNVRMPKSGGWDTVDFSTTRVNSVFCSHFVYFISGVIVPLELNATSYCIDEEGPGVQGFLNQEINHGTGHTALNKLAEEMGIGPTYTMQKFFTFVLTRIFPGKLSYAFMGVLESGFIVYVHFLSQSRWFFERFMPCPYWMIAYHLQEEAEHHWSSMHDIMQVGFGWRLAAWLLSVPLLTIMSMVYPLAAGLVYSWRILFLRGQILQSTVEFVLWMPPFLFLTHACTFLHVVCHMTPSATAYKAQLVEGTIRGRKSFGHIFDPYADMFRVVQVQDPTSGNHLMVPTKGFRPGDVIEGDTDLSLMRVLVKRWTAFSEAHDQLTKIGVPEGDLDAIFSKRQTEKAIARMSTKRRTSKNSQDAARLSISVASSGEAEEKGLPLFTMDAVRGKGYLVVNGNVVDVSAYKDHPGGQAPFKKFGGRDVSMQFEAIHSGLKASAKMEELRIGILAD